MSAEIIILCVLIMAGCVVAMRAINWLADKGEAYINHKYGPISDGIDDEAEEDETDVVQRA